MRRLRSSLERVAGLFGRTRRDRELADELDGHVQMHVDDNLRAGMPADEARRQALIKLGGRDTTKEQCRDRHGFPQIESMWRDIRHAARTLRRTPGLTAVALLTLAVGIGASTAVFTMVDSVVLRPLTYPDSGRLVVLWERVPSLSGPLGPNPRHVDLWKHRTTAFSGLALLRQKSSGLSVGTEHPQVIGTVAASPNLLDVLQVVPLMGRGFLPSDGVAGHDNVAILTYALWRNVFRGDPNAIGTTIRIDDIPREVIGVLPASFHFPNANALRAFRSTQAAASVPEPAVFLPAAIDLTQFSWNSDYGNWIALARLKAGIGIEQAEAQVTSIEAEIAQEIPASERDNRPGALAASVQSLQESVAHDSKTGLWLLMAAVISLMILACLNLANAQLGRTLSRHRETAVRIALGAARWRIVWSALGETLLLATIGGATGVLLAVAGLRLFRANSPVDLPRLSEAHVNVTVLLFSLALTCASSVLFTVLPALQLLRTNPQASLQKINMRSAGGRQSRHLRHWLIGAQVLGCTVLLLVTGLFSKSLIYLLHQDRGFDTGQLAIAQVDLPPRTYGTAQSRTAFDDAVLQNVREMAGIQSAALVSAMPLEGESWIEAVRRADEPNKDGSLVNLRWVSPGYFETVGGRLVAGRSFEERDRELSSAILSENEARALWQGGNPIGARILAEGRTFTVIGVVGDARNTSLKSPPARMVYLHYKDRPPYATFFIARSEQSASALVAGLRQAIWKRAPDITIGRVKTFDAQVSDSLATERFETLVLTCFAGAALLLAMLGIYGVLSHATVIRTQEFGVRLALGATRRDIYRLTLGEAGMPVLAGLGAGVLAGITAARVIETLLYGVRAVDPSVILAVAVLFVAAGAAAAFVPARRAASIAPMEALRSE
jgi:predicted permease